MNRGPPAWSQESPATRFLPVRDTPDSNGENHFDLVGMSFHCRLFTIRQV